MKGGAVVLVTVCLLGFASHQVDAKEASFDKSAGLRGLKNYQDGPPVHRDLLNWTWGSFTSYLRETFGGNSSEDESAVEETTNEEETDASEEAGEESVAEETEDEAVEEVTEDVDEEQDITEDEAEEAEGAKGGKENEDGVANENQEDMSDQEQNGVDSEVGEDGQNPDGSDAEGFNDEQESDDQDSTIDTQTAAAAGALVITLVGALMWTRRNHATEKADEVAPYTDELNADGDDHIHYKRTVVSSKLSLIQSTRS